MRFLVLSALLLSLPGTALAQDVAPGPEPTPEPTPAPAPAPTTSPAPLTVAGTTASAAPDLPAPPLGPRVDDPVIKGFQIGLRAGYVRALDASSASSLTYQTPSLLPIQLDLGYRTSTHVYLGLTGQLAVASRTDCANAVGTCAAKDYRIGGTFQYHFSPLRTFDPWFGLGLGYEILHLSGVSGDSGAHVTRTGIVLFDAQLGGDFALGSGLRAPKLGPFVGMAMGANGHESGVVYGRNIDRSPVHDHQWVTLGVRGTYDL